MDMKHLRDGEWVKSGDYTHHECCDCGLVHKYEYKLVDGVLYERWIRDPRETRKARKEMTLAKSKKSTPRNR